MADADFDEFDGYGYEEVRTSRTDRGLAAQGWINGAGALTSLALVAGLGAWGYNLAVRDVRGVPVIKALEGSARVAPDNPGGELAIHQGLAVNEIAADGTAAGAPDQLTLAPGAAGLSAEDQAMGELTPALETVAMPVAPDFDRVASLPVAPAAEAVPTPARLGAADPLPDGPVEQVLDAAIAPAPIAAEVIATDIPGVARSPRPSLRPAEPLRLAAATATDLVADTSSDMEIDYDAMAEAAAAAVAEAVAPRELDIDAASLAAGTRLVQIGAYPRKADARLEWDRTAQRFGALMDGKRRVIEEAASGGAVFYRLRVEGFVDADDATRFCAALKADGAECVLAVVR